MDIIGFILPMVFNDKECFVIGARSKWLISKFFAAMNWIHPSKMHHHQMSHYTYAALSPKCCANPIKEGWLLLFIFETSSVSQLKAQLFVKVDIEY